jgi:hypothetical protein
LNGYAVITGTQDGSERPDSFRRTSRLVVGTLGAIVLLYESDRAAEPARSLPFFCGQLQQLVMSPWARPASR